MELYQEKYYRTENEEDNVKMNAAMSKRRQAVKLSRSRGLHAFEKKSYANDIEKDQYIRSFKKCLSRLSHLQARIL